MRGRITGGEYPPGCRIPTQADLAEEFQAANRTVALAIATLRDEGHVWTQRHKGSYVSMPAHWRAC